jgi:hypothetical protein
MANDDPSSTPPPEGAVADGPTEAARSELPRNEETRNEEPRNEATRSDEPREQAPREPGPRNAGRRDGGGHRRGRGSKGAGGGEPRRPRLPQRDVADDEPYEPATAVAVADGEGADPEADRLDLAVLKEMSIQKLIEVAKELEIPGATSMKKQELVFQILRAQAEKAGAHPSIATCRGPTTSTCRPRRSASSTCGPATRSAARSVRPRRTSATSR